MFVSRDFRVICGTDKISSFPITWHVIPIQDTSDIYTVIPSILPLRKIILVVSAILRIFDLEYVKEA